VITNARDLLRFEQALAAGRILRPETVARYLSPRADIATEFFFKNGYGWRHQRGTTGEPVIWHSGTTGDSSSQFVRYGSDTLLIALWNRAVDMEVERDIVMRTTRTGPMGALGEALFAAMPEDAPPEARELTGEEAARLAGLPGAIELVTTPAGTDALAISPEGARALFPLVTEEAWRAVDEGLAALDAALEGVADPAGRSAALARAAAPADAGPLDPFDLWGRTTGDVIDRWQVYEAHHGPLVAARALAAAPFAADAADKWSALIELRFADGAVVRERYIRWHDEAYLLAGLPEALRLPLAVTAEGGLVGHDLLGRGTPSLDPGPPLRLRSE
jgi:hypothetical protein